MNSSHLDTGMLQAFLDETNRTICPKRKRNLFVMDNAEWPKSKMLGFGVFEP
jgi:hypothetical protein